MTSQLLRYMNWLALDGMPQAKSDPLRQIKEGGYDGVQFVEPLSPVLVQQALAAGLRVCGSGRVNQPADSARLAREARAESLECLTLHVGWGLEDDAQAGALIESILGAQTRFGVPLYPETHRATIFQDPWRTTTFVERFPQIEFNGDFSHWYTGTEFVYGGFEQKLAFIGPVLDRVSFLHGRIGNPGCMQVDIGEGDEAAQPFVSHFRALWTAAFTSFLRRKPIGSAIPFTTELLGPDIYYARTFEGHEESDRWTQSLVLVRIAEECFRNAQHAVGSVAEI